MDLPLLLVQAQGGQFSDDPQPCGDIILGITHSHSCGKDGIGALVAPNADANKVLRAYIFFLLIELIKPLGFVSSNKLLFLLIKFVKILKIHGGVAV